MTFWAPLADLGLTRHALTEHGRNAYSLPPYFKGGADIGPRGPKPKKKRLNFHEFLAFSLTFGRVLAISGSPGTPSPKMAASAYSLPPYFQGGAEIGRKSRRDPA